MVYSFQVFQYLLHINRIHAVNGLLHNSNLVHHVPGNFVEKYSMTTAEAAQHYSFVWMTYKQLNIRCEVFEEKFLMDIFELEMLIRILLLGMKM